jgi:hypothetical protein
MVRGKATRKLILDLRFWIPLNWTINSGCISRTRALPVGQGGGEELFVSGEAS